MTDIWTDGACSSSLDGVGGWAWATKDGTWQSSGAVLHTTNQRMEMYAAIKALDWANSRVFVIQVHNPPVIISDSAYVVNAFNDNWFDGWDMTVNPWVKRRNGRPVANSDLWHRLLGAVLHTHMGAEFVHVRGHRGNEMNEYVDKLAVAAKEKLMARLK
jgi:ribonuclease HI